MSLKAFHIFFIAVATVFLAGFGVWTLRRLVNLGGGGLDWALAFVALAGALALVVYGRAFLDKMKDVSYL